MLFLRSGPVPDPPHHQTLHSSIAWSYDLLRMEERAVLRSLSIFAGGWTLEAAEAVIPDACGVPERDVIQILSSAVSRSLSRWSLIALITSPFSNPSASKIPQGRIR